MRILYTYIIIFSILCGGLWGQLKSQVPKQNVGAMITGNNLSTTVPLLDPTRFDMHHSFSMSTMSLGGQAMNVAAYTNIMTYELNHNLHLGTRFSLVQPTGMMGPGNYGLNNTQFLYDANLQYRPSENTLIEFKMSNRPYYNRYNHHRLEYHPFYSNYYKERAP
jgi:hypothetical protein